jgi:hypothetical protein
MQRNFVKQQKDIGLRKLTCKYLVFYSFYNTVQASFVECSTRLILHSNLQKANNCTVIKILDTFNCR